MKILITQLTGVFIFSLRVWAWGVYNSFYNYSLVCVEKQLSEFLAESDDIFKGNINLHLNKREAEQASLQIYTTQI
jgi:hypothetical protein